MKTVNKPFRKKDAMQLVTGQPVYMDDIIPQDCLIVKLLRSPHANAIVRTINTAVAKKSARHRSYLHLGGCAAGCPPLYAGRPDLPGG